MRAGTNNEGSIYICIGKERGIHTSIEVEISKLYNIIHKSENKESMGVPWHWHHEGPQDLAIFLPI